MMTLDQALLLAERAAHELRDKAYDDFAASLNAQDMPRDMRRSALHWCASVLDAELTRQLANVRRELAAAYA